MATWSLPLSKCSRQAYSIYPYASGNCLCHINHLSTLVNGGLRMGGRAQENNASVCYENCKSAGHYWYRILLVNSHASDSRRVVQG